MKCLIMRYVFCVLAFLILKTGYAQDKKEADQLFEMGNFEEAYEIYSLLFEQDGANSFYQYRLAICALNINQPKNEAILLLESLLKKDDHDPNTLYLLGRAYQFDYKFSEAVNCFKKFLEEKKGNEENLSIAGRQIEYCENAIELMKYPTAIQFENLGNEINSPFADYYPFVASDESFIIYNSKRNNGSDKMLNGTYTSDVYFSFSKGGFFQKSKPLSKKINSKKFNEEVVGISSNNDKAILFFSEDNYSTKGQLAIMDIHNGDFSNKQDLPESINTKYSEISATMNKESNEIYFASDMPGGYGGTDLYVSRILPNGEWGPPQNLGPAINTIYNEDFPVLSSDKKIIYFSSKGHTSMGGYDIFKATFDEEKNKFVQPRNLGYPINTPMDDMNFSVSESGKYGYISAIRKEGLGDYDIYRVTFDDIEPNYTIINGQIITENNQELSSISMIVYDEKGELFGEYLPNLNTHRYVIILPPGKYTLSLEADNFELYEEQINILGKDAFQFTIDKDIHLILKK